MKQSGLDKGMTLDQKLDLTEQRTNRYLRFLTPVIAIIFSMIVGGIIISLAGVNPFLAYRHLFYGAFGSLTNFAETLVKTTPLLIAGIGVSIAFRCNLTNVGAEGQMTVGAIVAVVVAFLLPGLPSFLAVLIVILAGFVGGGLYGAVPGYLKAKFGTSEIISSIMLNYIATSFLAFLLDGPMKEEGGTFPQTALMPKSTHLYRFMDGSRLNIGIIIAILLVALYYILMFRSPLGYKIRAVGSNPTAASYAGISVKRHIVLAMVLSGGLAGIAGMSEVFGLHLRLYNGISAGYGFNAVALALLGRLHPVGVALAALFFGSLSVGATAMQNAVQVPVAVVNVIQGVSILFILTDQFIRDGILHRLKSHRNKKRKDAQMEVN